jgi:C-terminal processing protease CtpA/Prc
MGRRVRRVAAAGALLFLALAARADTTTGETDRLMSLARVWAMAKYLDPAVVLSDVDWDRSLVKAIPAVRAAKSDDDFAAAVDGMLRTLNDPATTVLTYAATPPAGPAVPLYRIEEGIVIVNLGGYAARHGADAMWATVSSALPEIAKSSGVIVDLRGSPETAADVASVVGVMNTLVRQNVNAPAARVLLHSGYAPQQGETSGGYYSGFLLLPGAWMNAPRDGRAPMRVVFVADARARVPALALAMREAGLAAIVSDGAIDEGNFAPTRIEPLDARHAVRLRTGHLLAADSHADVVTATPMPAAMALATGRQPMPKRAAPASAENVTPKPYKERDYPEMAYPDPEYRLLAAFRIWSVIEFFYPYRHLLGDWDAVLREAIPRFLAARDASDYTRAVMEMAAHVEDGHTSVGGPGVTRLLGNGRLPFALMQVEGQPAVVQLYPELPKDAGVQVGDVVVSVDGEPMAARMARLRPLLTASTETARNDRIANAALFGPKETPARLELRGADGGVRVVTLARTTAFQSDLGRDAWKLLPGNIGYVNLARLTVPQVEAMFAALKDTRALVFDMRGYPNGTAWPIAERINTRKAKVGALFRRPMFTGNSWSGETSAGWFFEQQVPGGSESKTPKYAGRTVMLIDDRAISQSEHTALFFEQANGTTFIGTPTAGANGDVTNYVVPGGLTIRFTGHDVRHADGRQLQRIGIQPDVVAAPTLAGLRAGRDEVLERALAYLNDATH